VVPAKSEASYSQRLYSGGMLFWAAGVIILWRYCYNLWPTWKSVTPSQAVALTVIAAIGLAVAFTGACIGIIEGVGRFVPVTKVQDAALFRLGEFLRGTAIVLSCLAGLWWLWPIGQLILWYGLF